MYRFNAIPIKIPMLFLKKYDVYKKSSVLYETTKDPIKGNPGKEKIKQEVSHSLASNNTTK